MTRASATSQDNQARTDSRQRRAAVGMAALIAFGLGVYSLFSIPEMFPFRSWSLTIANGIPPFLAILAAISAGLSWRGRPQVGVFLLFGGLWAVLLLAPTIISGFGFVAGAFVFLVTAVVAGQTLSSNLSGRAIVVGTVVGLAVLLLDLFWPGERIRGASNLIAIASSIALVLAAIYLVIVARQYRAYSLRAKLIIAFVGVVVLSVGLVAFITDRQVRAGLTQTVGANLNSAARSQAATLTDLLVKQVNNLQAFGLSRVVQDQVEAANSAYTGDAAAIQAVLEARDTQWRAADAANNDADPLVQSILQADSASELSEFRQAFPDHLEVFITDRYGGNVATTNRTSDYMQSDEGWWQAAYNNGQGAVFIGQPEFDDSVGAYSVIMALPLYGHGTREVVGVLRTTYRLTALTNVLSGSAFGAVSSDLLLPGAQVLRAEGDLVPLGAEVARNLDATANDLFGQFNYDEGLRFVSQAPIASSDPQLSATIAQLNWRVIYDVDSVTALSLVEATTRASLLTAVGALVLAAILAVGVANLLADPINRLTATATLIAGGDLTAQARVETEDETGTLARAFNTMTAQLRDTLAGLEQRVTERTRDLALAAEVGQSVSAVRDLDSLLINAVELVRSRFDLYYAQVYLTNATNTALELKAGTGEVGRQLLQRAHRLPVGPGSLNGRAAAEKRAVIVADTTADASFRPNPLLPQTRSEMCVPLIAGDRVVGVLDLQSARAGALTADNLPAFQALAGQLAVAIQNANLFAETQAARAEVEERARRLTHSNWQAFLDAMERSETFGFSFDQVALRPLTAPLTEEASERVLTVPVTVAGEPVGTLQLEGTADQVWSQDDIELATVVARQVAQQVENLRLLAQAEQARAQAEDATRRLTREGWETYLQATQHMGAGYAYDLNQITPLQRGPSPSAAATLSVMYPLTVQGEQIGELAVSPEAGLDESQTALVATVTARLSAHLENLRLTEQTQRALTEAEAQATRLAVLNELGRVLTTLRQESDLYEKVYEFVSRVMDATNFYVALYDAANQTVSFPVIYDNRLAIRAPARPLGTGMTEYVLRTGEALLLSANVIEGMRALGLELLTVGDARPAQSWLGVPLRYGDQVLGVMAAQSITTPGLYTATERDLLTAIANQVSIAIENLRSFSQTQQRAEREALINAINQKIRSTISVESAVQVAAREIGQLLKVRRAVVEIGGTDTLNGKEATQS